MSELNSALAAAREAGAILRERWPAEREVRVKGYRDIVTEADVAAQSAILARLKADYPDHEILAEEGGGDYRADDPRPTWIVDPLDGTTNYARRIPMFAVAIGLAVGGEVRVGVVYDPLRDMTFYAERGGGAYLARGGGEPERLRVSETKTLAEAVVGVDWSHANDVRREVLSALSRVGLACGTMRGIGSAALGIAFVAPGWFDAYYHFALKPWDVAGPSLIASEAGGTLTTPDGLPWQLGQSRLVITNGRFQSELLKVMGLHAHLA
ncbi:MAG: inositol monophosphatase [Chloroflexi bacterium]|nr:inositol monophosphatase [Chloroflexota bacterium]